MYVAEMTAWGTAILFLALIHTTELRASTYRWGLVLTGLLVLWQIGLFRLILPRLGGRRWMLGLGVVVNMAFISTAFGLLQVEIPAIPLIFVPAIIATGLLGSIEQALAAPVLAFGGLWIASAIAGADIDTAYLTLAGGVFLLSGAVAGLLARELRQHYHGEHEEHRLATAVRHRLMAVLDAIDEGIVFSDRQGVVRVVNRRASDLFEVDPDEHLGLVVVQLLRTLARKTEDPEGFMENFQLLRDDPERELRTEVEQIIPARRQLRLYSAPAHDETGALVGRIDVYTDVTETVARAAEIERLYEQARKTAESYQRSLLPEETPSLPRLSFVAHYVPAAGQRAVCGDFYDFLYLPAGYVGVVLGDVCGIGPRAVGDAALTRYTLKSFAATELNPGLVLQRMNSHIRAHIGADRFVRLFFGVLDPERAVLEYACAGHVPPVLFRSKSGEVEVLGEGGLPLAVEEETDYKIGRAEFDPGDMLVLYTDGVTEAARRGRPFGQGRFLDLVKRYGVGTPGEMSQAIRRAVDAWVEAEQMRDDIAMLVCQVVPDATIGEPTRELVVPNETSRLAEIRAFVASYLVDLHAPIEASTDVLIAAGEAAGNACRHGRNPGGRSEVRVRCALKESTVSITIADDGPGFDLGRIDPGTLPDRFASGGRGLFLMRRLMDSVEIDTTGVGTTVNMTRRLWTLRPPGSISKRLGPSGAPGEPNGGAAGRSVRDSRPLGKDGGIE
jgi:serine phosphatase RsbU (regulator of sigma subunit)/anti-sigma regulatory factor (Ser/Thr protein kinase)